MTLPEINFALEQRMPVVMPRRSEFDEERGLDGYFWEVQLIDANGRGWINAGPEQLDPAEPEKFSAMWARYNELKRRRDNAEC